MPWLPLHKQEQYRKRYKALSPGWRPATEVYEGLVKGYVGPETRILDLGCGRGGVVERIHQRAGLTVGADVDVTSLMEHRAPAIGRVAADAGALPFADESFDLVICSWVLEHLQRPRMTFIEISRVLRPGGHFVFLTPNARHPVPIINRLFSARLQHRLVSFFYGRAHKDTFPVVYRANTRERINALAESAGLRCVSFVYVEDPTYLALNELGFRLGIFLEKLIPQTRKVHLVGDYVKQSQRRET